MKSNNVRPEWLAQMKTGAGTAKAAGIELTLLDPSSRAAPGETSGRWKIAVNGPVAFDA